MEDSWWTISVASLVIVVSAVLGLSCGQTDTQTDANERFTPATVVGVSNCVLHNKILWTFPIVSPNQVIGDMSLSPGFGA